MCRLLKAVNQNPSFICRIRTAALSKRTKGKEVVVPKMTRKTPIRKLGAVSAAMLIAFLAATACASSTTGNASGPSDTLTVVGWKGAAGQVANMP